MNEKLWYLDEGRIEFHSPAAVHLRAHPDPSAPRLTPVTHQLFGAGFSVNAPESFSGLGEIVRVVFPDSSLDGSYSTNFLVPRQFSTAPE